MTTQQLQEQLKRQLTKQLAAEIRKTPLSFETIQKLQQQLNKLQSSTI